MFKRAIDLKYTFYSYNEDILKLYITYLLQVSVLEYNNVIIY